ncbi:MAG TPA: hypothetical protein VKA60_26840 [Blastocatellia bacterium]|nr:hypothetical protein [Blastocatellia bacterium]
MTTSHLYHRHKSLKVLFLGQCLQYGYQGVEKSSTFVNVAAANLARQLRPLRLRLDLKHLYHPKGLKAILKHRLRLARPDIVVISVVATFAAAYTRVNLIYEIAPEVIDTARSFLQKVEAKYARRGNTVKSETPLDKLMSWHPPLRLDEYERLVNEGVELCRTGGCRVVLLGPGRFNEDAVMGGYTTPSPALWSSVNDMVRRVSRAQGATMIDCAGVLSEHGGEVFMPNNIRYSPFGHQVLAREVEQVLAAEARALLSGSPGGSALL